MSLVVVFARPFSRITAAADLTEIRERGREGTGTPVKDLQGEVPGGNQILAQAIQELQ